MKRLAIPAIVLVALLFLPAGCGGASADVNIRGSIASLEAAQNGGDVLGTMLVQGAIEEDTEYDQASVRITRSTKIVAGEGYGASSATFEDLVVGRRVEVAFEGPVAESYPVQATAAQVTIIR
jgi:hypothetical protein